MVCKGGEPVALDERAIHWINKLRTATIQIRQLSADPPVVQVANKGGQSWLRNYLFSWRRVKQP